MTRLLELIKISKRFPGVLANDRVDLGVSEGELMALLGENGAGKTTLVNILVGLYQPDAGEIRWQGRPVTIRSPRDAGHLGIGMVHQHFKLVPSFTVTENILLGLPRHRIRPGDIADRLATLGRTYGLDVDPSARVGQLSVGEQQRVELLRQLFLDAKLLILDEPTAALTPGEAAHLFEILRAMTRERRAVILITHKLPEVMALADTITVLRHGRVAGRLTRSEASGAALTRLMVGRSLEGLPARSVVSSGPPVLSLLGVACDSAPGEVPLRDVSLDVATGSILGIAGVAGNGQRELAEVASGLRRPSRGRVIVADRDLTGASTGSFIRAGVLYVPEDRLGTGVAPGLRVWENLILRAYARPPIDRWGIMDVAQARNYASHLVTRFDVKAPSLDIPVRYLSGGNIQKVVFAREISSAPRVLVAAHPTRGLDVSATQLVQRLLVAAREAGLGVLLISEDLDELQLLSDQIAVLYRGRVMGRTAVPSRDRDRIGSWMAGVPGGTDPGTPGIT